MADRHNDTAFGALILSRRRLLALGAAVAGSRVVRPSVAAAAVVPTAWHIDSTVNTWLKTLGQAIVLDQNFYTQGSYKYAADTNTIPILNEWQVYVQEDTAGASWQLANENRTLFVRQITRIPYFVRVGSSQVLVDHLLVGYTGLLRRASNPQAADYWDPTPSLMTTGTTPTADDFQSLGAFLMFDRNPYLPNRTNVTVAKPHGLTTIPPPAPPSPPNPPTPNLCQNTNIPCRVVNQRLHWTFRGKPIRIEKAISIPYKVQDDNNPNPNVWYDTSLLVGYEGAGGY